MNISCKNIHWCIFNVMARCFGIVATFGGVVFSGWGIYLIINPKSTIGGSIGAENLGWIYLVAGAFVEIIGWAFIKVRPYRPDLEDKITKQKTDEHRGWWTGTIRK